MSKIFESKNLFFTYSQFKWEDPAPLDPKEYLLTLLYKKADSVRINIEGYIIAMERHADNGIHFHVFLSLDYPIKSRNPRLFDIHGNHPNV